MDQAKWQDIFNDHQPNACLAIERVPHAFNDNSTCRDWSFLSTRHRFLTFTLWICSALTSISAFADELKVDEVAALIDA